jgi:hypothetical protein
MIRTALALALLWAPQSAPPPPLPEADRAAIGRRLDGVWRRVEPEVKVSVREFFSIALDAAASGWHPERVERAFDLARKAQDKDEKSKTYGNFLWNWTDDRVIDRNSVEFCMQKGSLLWMFHRERLSEKARGQLEELVRFSVEGIRRHGVGVGYTNIYLMKIWNCIALGENTGRPELAEEGRKMLDDWLAAVARTGVREYLSPTYTAVDLESLSLLAKFSKDEVVRKKALAALEFVWTDVAANWFPPAERLGGAHSRDYDYLTGHGMLDEWVRDAGWPEGGAPAARAPNVFMELCRWSPPKEVLRRAGGTVPRFIRQRWGDRPGQWASQHVGREFALGAAGACYWNMDKSLVLNWAGGAKVPTTQFFLDGRGDPYGKSKIAESGAHSKSLHLMPFVAAVQRGPEVLHLAAIDMGWKNVGHAKEEVRQLSAHLVLPVAVQVWKGDERVGGAGPLPLEGACFLRNGGVAVGLRFLHAVDGAGKPGRLAWVQDGEAFGAARITCTLSEGKPEGLAAVVLWVRAAEGLDDAGFARFRKEFAAAAVKVQVEGAALRCEAAGLRGPMRIEADLEKQAVLAAEGGEPDTGLLVVDGRDLGREALSRIPGGFPVR